MATARVLTLLLLQLLLIAAANADFQAGAGGLQTCPAAPGLGNRSAAHRLHHDLFCAYHTSVLPIADVTKHMEVDVNVWLHSIYLNEYYHKTLDVNSWILMTWNDDYLPWNPDAYDGVNYVRVPADKIWTPIFIVLNPYHGPSLKGEKPTEVCVVSHKGDVECMWPATFSLACRLQYALWPFDTQICQFSLLAINDNTSRLTLTVHNQSLTMFMLENPEWEQVSSRVDESRVFCPVCPPGEQMPSLNFWLVLRRRAAVYLAAVTVPALGTALLTLLPYLLPPSLPQRALLAATGVVAHIFILQVLSSIMYGPAGTAVPPIVMLFRDSLALNTLSLLMSVAHRWLVAASPDPPILLRNASSRLLDLWARNLSFARLQVEEVPSQPGTPATDFWQRWTSAVDGCVLAVSVIAYVIVLARFSP